MNLSEDAATALEAMVTAGTLERSFRSIPESAHVEDFPLGGLYDRVITVDEVDAAQSGDFHEVTERVSVVLMQRSKDPASSYDGLFTLAMQHLQALRTEEDAQSRYANAHIDRGGEVRLQEADFHGNAVYVAEYRLARHRSLDIQNP